MGTPNANATLVQQKASGTLLNTFTTAKSILNPTELYDFPRNFLQVGSALRISGILGLSNIVTSAGTFALQIMMGSVVSFTTGNIVFTTTANTLASVFFEALLRLDTSGSSTNAKWMGAMILHGINIQTPGSTAAANPTTGAQSVIVPATPADGTGWDSTVVETLDLWLGFSNSNAGNGVQIQNYCVEYLAGTAP